jgi:hypothetical protein
MVSFTRPRPGKIGSLFSKIGGVSLSSIADFQGVERQKQNVTMKTLAKIFLMSSIVLFVVSLTGPGGEFLWGFLKPLSAFLFVNFFIMNLLAKEYVLYDEDHRLHAAVPKPQSQPQTVAHGPVRPGYAT